MGTWTRAGVLEAKIAAIKAVIARHDLNRARLNPAVAVDCLHIENIDMMLTIAKRNLHEAEKELEGLS